MQGVGILKWLHNNLLMQAKLTFLQTVNPRIMSFIHAVLYISNVHLEMWSKTESICALLAGPILIVCAGPSLGTAPAQPPLN